MKLKYDAADKLMKQKNSKRTLYTHGTQGDSYRTNSSNTPETLKFPNHPA